MCRGCGAEPAEDEPYPFHCPRFGDGDVDHTLRRGLDPATIHDPAGIFASDEPNPFLRFRRLLHSWHVGRQRGLSDADYCELVVQVDSAVAGIAGESSGFLETPLDAQDALGRCLGMVPNALLVKDETGNVSGSHKGRHLMAIALWLEMADRTGLIANRDSGAKLAIPSCGNAALAATVVAAATGRDLTVYVPVQADESIIDRMTSLGAQVVTCPREARSLGDPCQRRFLEAVEAGRLPFACQGHTNALAIEGGATLAWEMVSSLARREATIDRLFVQVGGGALATACIQGFREAVALGGLRTMPRIHAVQTEGAYPLAAAWSRFAARLEIDDALSTAEQGARLEGLAGSEVEAALQHAATHRSEYMSPWPVEPRSIAKAILDDETYDWLAVVEGMATSGGFPVVVDEATLRSAHDLARETTDVPASPTGTAGLAGLMKLRREGLVGPGERVAVLFTGVER